VALIAAVGAFGAATLGGLAAAPAARADPNFSWTPTGIPGRAQAAMAFDDATGTAVLFGGHEGDGGGDPGDTWTWDGSAWTPRTPADSPSPRAGAAAAYDAATGTVVLFGGSGGSLDDTWTWDGTDWTQQSPAHSPPAGYVFGAMAYDDATGTVVLFDNGTWTWDGTTKDWTHEQPADSPPFHSQVMTYDAATGTVVAFGLASIPPTCTTPACLVSETWAWDGNNWTLVDVGSVPPRFGSPAMAYDADQQQVVLFGGEGVSCAGSCGDTWTWDATNGWTQQAPAHSPSPRGWSTEIYDPVGHDVLLFGGGRADIHGDWWTWDGTTKDWTQQSPGTNPPPRQGLSMAYDEARREVVLFGGEGRGDTWTWDGAVWRQSPASGPPARVLAGMAYDSDHQETVLFGGTDAVSSNDVTFDDTWTWDGAVWTQSPANGPSARAGPSVAYDQATHSAVLFGGNGACGNAYCGDTWTWDGTVWTHEHPDPSPPASAYGAMAYDAARGNVVLFTGQCPGSLCSETWTWDGTDWTKHSPTDSPPGRAYAQIAYDPASQAVVMFGGGNGGFASARRDTWAWDGHAWTQLSLPISPPARYAGGMAFDSNGSALLFGGYISDPGIDSGSFSYGAKPTVVRVLGKAGGTVATKPANTTHPLSTSVTVGSTDVGGQASIAQLARSTHKAPAGYAFLPAQDVIAAPRGTPVSPLTLRFTLHSSLVAGDPGDPVTLFRTEFGHKPQQVANCTSESPPTPDPCISDQSTLGDGSVHFTVLSSSASTWNFALPGVKRSLSIAYRHKRLFKGKLSSSEHACMAGQKVTVYRKHSGPDRKVGADVTSSTGVYKVREHDAKGTYYASVPQHEEPSLGICEAAKSKVLHA
jgi:hypothetical protein